MSSAPKLGKYQAPSGSFPYYGNGYSYDATQQSGIAAAQNRQAIADSTDQFNQQYPALAEASKKYQQNVSDAQYGGTGGLYAAQHDAQLGDAAAQNRSNGQGAQQSAEAKALGGLSDASALKGLAGNRLGLDSSARGNELAALRGVNALENQTYTPNPLWDKIQRQGAGMISGTNTISPLLQQQFMNAGLQSQGQALGVASLGTGTQAQMGLARNLGLDLNQYVTQQQNQGQSLLGTAESGKTSDLGLFTGQQANQRANLAQGYQQATGTQNLSDSLQQALNQQYQQTGQLAQQGQALTSSVQGQAYGQDAGLFNTANALNAAAQTVYPHNQIDLPGSAKVSLGLQNLANDYASAQAGYAAQVQNAAYQANQQSQQAGLNAQASGQNMQTAGTAASIAATAAAAYCWVARSAYGGGNPRWLEFRNWMVTRAPRWFYRAYGRHGIGVATWLDRHPGFKPFVRAWMDAILERAA